MLKWTDYKEYTTLGVYDYIILHFYIAYYYFIIHFILIAIRTDCLARLLFYSL